MIQKQEMFDHQMKESKEREENLRKMNSSIMKALDDLTKEQNPLHVYLSSSLT